MPYSCPQGGCVGFFNPSEGTLSDWWIEHPAGTILAQQSAPVGWTVTDELYTFGGTTITYQITFCAPSSATIATGYVLKLFPSGNEYPFDVVAAASPAGGSRRRAGDEVFT